MKSKNEALRYSFVNYCLEHPEMRFWQALRNWCGWGFVWVSKEFDPREAIDTFYWKENKSAPTQ